MINADLSTDIHNDLLDGASECPGSLTRIVVSDRLTTVVPHIEPLTSNRKFAGLGLDLAFPYLIVVNVDGKRSIGNTWWILTFPLV